MAWTRIILANRNSPRDRLRLIILRAALEPARVSSVFLSSFRAEINAPAETYYGQRIRVAFIVLFGKDARRKSARPISLIDVELCEEEAARFVTSLLRLYVFRSQSVLREFFSRGG